MLLKIIKTALQRRKPAADTQQLAVEHYQRGDLETAADYFRDVAANAPGDPTAWTNLAATLVRLQKYGAAVPVLSHLVELQPHLAEAHLDLGVCRSRLKDNTAAIEHYRRAIALKPDLHKAHANLLDAYLESCDWGAVDRWMDDFTAYRAAHPIETWSQRMEPFCALILCPRDVCKALAAQRAAMIGRRVSPLPPPPPRRHDKIRVGYVSGDLYNHATAQLTYGLYEAHDRNAFEVYAYSTGPDDGSEYRRHIAQSCDCFVDVRRETPQSIAARIRDDEIDIVVDMNGYTANSRPDIFAFRAAPVQVAYLGYPGTTGAPWIDWYITDRIATPPGHEDEFTEQLAYLPDSYQVNDNRQPIATQTSQRPDFGLPEDAFVFCSFNRLGKIDRTIFATWMDILRRVPGSVLWLIREDETAVANLRRAARASGIDPARLVFADKVEKARHLARHRLADLFLDTYRCNAHTGASDALWAGLPLLTCPGDMFITRVAASLLRAAGLPELVADNLEHYADTAVHLANDRAALQAIKERLEYGRLACPLFDTRRYVRHLESAYRSMHQRHLEGLPPASFTVAPSQ